MPLLASSESARPNPPFGRQTCGAHSRARAGLPPAPISRSDDDWPYPLHKLQRGEMTIEQVLAIAETDQNTGDRRRVGETLFVAAEREAVRGRSDEAVKLYERAVAVQAPRHAWKIAAERELERFARPR